MLFAYIVENTTKIKKTKIVEVVYLLRVKSQI